jgi:hypothetical protein
MTEDEAKRGRYLGDGAYVTLNKWAAVILTTSAHYGHPDAENHVHLGEPELKALERYIAEAREQELIN